MGVASILIRLALWGELLKRVLVAYTISLIHEFPKSNRRCSGKWVVILHPLPWHHHGFQPGQDVGVQRDAVDMGRAVEMREGTCPREEARV